MRTSFKFAISACFALWLTGGAATAAPLSGEGSLLTDADLVAAPHAFQNFCRDRSDQCVSRGRGGLAKLDRAAWAQLASVNTYVNHAIRPLAGPPGDAYRLGVKAGSCNEYAVEKRRELLARGWSAAALSLTVVRLPDGRGHLVLTVRTDQGDFVLDNLNNNVVAVAQTDYSFIERQSTIHPMLWVRIGGLATAQGSSAVAVNETR